MKLLSKKLCSLGLGGLLAFSMVGCASTDNTSASADTDNTAAVVED